MHVALESNFLLPDRTFVVESALYAVAIVLLVVWPLVGAVMRRQWTWVVMIVVFGPFAGAGWFSRGRHHRGPDAR